MRLVKITDLPPWYEVNPYVQTGYRPVMGFWPTLRTLFQWHNETLNIYTHLLPGLYYLIMWFLLNPTCSIDCRMVYSYSYFSAAMMGLCSGIGHTLYSVSPRINEIAWKLDFTGVIMSNSIHLLMDSYIVCIMLLENYNLYRIGVIFQLVAMLTVLYTIWSKPLVVGQLWGIVYPVVTSVPLTISLYTWAQFYETDPLIHNAIQASLNCSICIWIAGIFFFKGRLPERLYSHWIFDYMSSHVWHHVFCVLCIVAGFQVFPLIEKYQMSH
jgi:adiponectin receptor